CRRGAAGRRGGGGTRHRDAHPLRVLGGQLGAAVAGSPRADGLVPALSGQRHAGPRPRRAATQGAWPARHAAGRGAGRGEATAGGRRLRLRIAIDYSARDAILHAARGLNGAPTREAFARGLGEAYGEPHGAPDVDLLIRTGGEQRLSDFLLWECAYAELYFTETMWPDFGAAELAAAVAEFRARERRFGGLPEAAAG